jgi:predicted nucleic acid-binding protein
MILLDTAVVLEPLRRKCNMEVVQWLDHVVLETCCIASATLAEIFWAVEKLPPLQRAALRHANIEEAIMELFEGRILTFDARSAQAFGNVIRNVRHLGYTISRRDAELAALAREWQMAVGTWNPVPFQAAGCPVQVPWGWAAEI